MKHSEKDHLVLEQGTMKPGDNNREFLRVLSDGYTRRVKRVMDSGISDPDQLKDLKSAHDALIFAFEAQPVKVDDEIEP